MSVFAIVCVFVCMGVLLCVLVCVCVHLYCTVCLCVCVCFSFRGRGSCSMQCWMVSISLPLPLVCVCVCVCERERGRGERETVRESCFVSLKCLECSLYWKDPIYMYVFVVVHVKLPQSPVLHKCSSHLFSINISYVMMMIF